MEMECKRCGDLINCRHRYPTNWCDLCAQKIAAKSVAALLVLNEWIARQLETAADVIEISERDVTEKHRLIRGVLSKAVGLPESKAEIAERPE